MSDKTALGISEELRQFIEALVGEVVLEGKSFEEHKKYLSRFCQTEDVDYNLLETNLGALFETAEELTAHESKGCERLLQLLAKECYISLDLINKIISDINTKRRKLEDEIRVNDEARCRAEEEARRKREAEARANAEKAVRKAKEEAERKAHEEIKKTLEKTERERKTKADSLYQKGHSFFIHDNFKEAIPCLFESAILGDSRAQSELSNCYMNGTGIVQSDIEAFKWAMASAQQNNPLGQVFVGFYFLYGGESIKPNDEQAYLWFKKSADQNFPMGLYYLGQCYYCGVGVTPNIKLAYECFRKSTYSRAKDILKGETLPLLTKEYLEKERKAKQQKSDK